MLISSQPYIGIEQKFTRMLRFSFSLHIKSKILPKLVFEDWTQSYFITLLYVWSFHFIFVSCSIFLHQATSLPFVIWVHLYLCVCVSFWKSNILLRYLKESISSFRDNYSAQLEANCYLQLLQYGKVKVGAITQRHFSLRCLKVVKFWPSCSQFSIFVFWIYKLLRVHLVAFLLGIIQRVLCPP